MLCLNDVHDGRSCSIIWLIGKTGTLIRNACGLQLDDRLEMIRNSGKDGVIVRNGSRRIAMSYDASYAVKVELCQ
jgi:hypothetical protein